MGSEPSIECLRYCRLEPPIEAVVPVAKALLFDDEPMGAKGLVEVGEAGNVGLALVLVNGTVEAEKGEMTLEGDLLRRDAEDDEKSG